MTASIGLRSRVLYFFGSASAVEISGRISKELIYCGLLWRDRLFVTSVEASTLLCHGILGLVGIGILRVVLIRCRVHQVHHVCALGHVRSLGDNGIVAGLDTQRAVPSSPA